VRASEKDERDEKFTASISAKERKFALASIPRRGDGGGNEFL